MTLEPKLTALALALGGAAVVALTGQGTPWGALAGLAVATLAILGLGPGALLPLAIFVLGSGALTRIGRARKAALGAAEGNQGRRGVGNVAANLGLPALVGAFGMVRPDAYPLTLAYAASLAAAMADTAATEVGPLAGGPVVRFRGFRLERAEHGSVGGMSLAGVAAAACGASLIGWSAAATGLLPRGAEAGVAAASGFAAALVESLVSQTRFGVRLGHHGRNALVSIGAAGLAVAWAACGGGKA
jgi:uncharacterized protein (TIGR00297 family)